MTESIGCVRADWPAASAVSALTTTRASGSSVGPWSSLNLAVHVGDEAATVQRNREHLVRALDLPAAPQWLDQVHGCEVVRAAVDGVVRTADAAYTDRTGVVCAVLTADCLPIAICDRAGREVAIAHGGWRGLAGGVLRASVAHFRAPMAELLVWLGPAIGPGAFEVGVEVREAFLASALGVEHSAAIDASFRPLPNGKFLADLYSLAGAECRALGIGSVHGGGFCTYTDAARVYSFRRDGHTGRMATLIWINP